MAIRSFASHFSNECVISFASTKRTTSTLSLTLYHPLSTWPQRSPLSERSGAPETVVTFSKIPTETTKNQAHGKIPRLTSRDPRSHLGLQPFPQQYHRSLSRILHHQTHPGLPALKNRICTRCSLSPQPTHPCPSQYKPASPYRNGTHIIPEERMASLAQTVREQERGPPSSGDSVLGKILCLYAPRLGYVCWLQCSQNARILCRSAEASTR